MLLIQRVRTIIDIHERICHIRRGYLYPPFSNNPAFSIHIKKNPLNTPTTHPLPIDTECHSQVFLNVVFAMFGLASMIFTKLKACTTETQSPYLLTV